MSHSGLSVSNRSNLRACPTLASGGSGGTARGRDGFSLRFMSRGGSYKRGLSVERFVNGVVAGVLVSVVVVAAYVWTTRTTDTLERIEAAVTAPADGAGPVAPAVP